jgi:hypothetical protein
MSGNNNTDHDTPTGGGGADNTPNCATLSGRGTIMSPVAAVLVTLNVGDILTISLRSATGPVQAFTIAGQLVGSVLLSSVFSTSLIYCINEQFEYQGRITSLVGGSCELVISVR